MRALIRSSQATCATHDSVPAMRAQVRGNGTRHRVPSGHARGRLGASVASEALPRFAPDCDPCSSMALPVGDRGAAGARGAGSNLSSGNSARDTQRCARSRRPCSPHTLSVPCAPFPVSRSRNAKRAAGAIARKGAAALATATTVGELLAPVIAATNWGCRPALIKKVTVPAAKNHSTPRPLGQRKRQPQTH